MPRAYPGQLSLFDDVPAGLLATSEPAGPWRPEPVPDRLSLALLPGPRASGALVAAGEALAERHGMAAPAFLDLFHLPLFDFGAEAELAPRDRTALEATGDRLSLPRLSVGAQAIGGLVLEDGLPAIALLLEPSEALEALLEHVSGALRDRRLGHLCAAADSSTLLLGPTLALLPEQRLDQPLDLAFRDLALIRHCGADGRHDIVRRWALSA